MKIVVLTISAKHSHILYACLRRTYKAEDFTQTITITVLPGQWVTVQGHTPSDTIVLPSDQPLYCHCTYWCCYRSCSRVLHNNEYNTKFLKLYNLKMPCSSKVTCIHLHSLQSSGWKTLRMLTTRAKVEFSQAVT